jgi:hypothetical protein
MNLADKTLLESSKVNSKNRNGFSSLKENRTGSAGCTGYSYAKTKLS